MSEWGQIFDLGVYIGPEKWLMLFSLPSKYYFDLALYSILCDFSFLFFVLYKNIKTEITELNSMT